MSPSGSVGGVRNGGRDIARFDVTVDANKNVTSATVTIVDMADVEPSQALRDLPLIQEAHQATIDFIQGGGECSAK